MATQDANLTLTDGQDTVGPASTDNSTVTDIADSVVGATGNDSIGMNDYLQGQIDNPTLSDEAKGNVTLLGDVAGAESLRTTDPLTGYAANQYDITTAEQANYNPQDLLSQQASGQATLANQQQYQPAATYEATTITDQTPQIEVTDLMTTAGQLDKLTKNFDIKNPPAWAAGSVRAAQEMLAARGIASSSFAGYAITNAIMDSAVPIAKGDADTHFKAAVENVNNKVKTLMSDQAAINASKQFNATSENDTKQFFAKLWDGIEQHNSTMLTTISQFNAEQTNKMATAANENQAYVAVQNANIRAKVRELNQSMASQRDQFYRTAAMEIEQANVNWRRNINTADTAAVNAYNQRVADLYANRSAYAMEALVQNARDIADKLFQEKSSATEFSRSVALAAMGEDYAEDQQMKSDLRRLAGRAIDFFFSL